MAKTTRQTAIFGAEDWKRIYQTYKEADFQSYDFETLRKSFVDYLKLYYPETFNDFTESSEFVALLDLMAFMGQSLAFRNDLNTRENFLDTAERRDSVIKLANLIGYSPKRNLNARGFLKVLSVNTTENVLDFNGFSLASVTILWNDVTNPDWVEQFSSIINATLIDSQRIGRSGNSQEILGVTNDEYQINVLPNSLPIASFTTEVNGTNMSFEITSSSSVGKSYIYEPAVKPNGEFNILYRNDKLGYGSESTGYFFQFKQGTTITQDFNIADKITNRKISVNVDGVNNDDISLFKLKTNGEIETEWKQIENIYATDSSVTELSAQRNVYSVNSRANDQIDLIFGDGVFSQIPLGNFRLYTRASNGLEYVINPSEVQSVQLPISYVSRHGRIETLTVTLGLQTPISNAKSRETINEIKERAPARFYTQNRMVNGEDYNNFPFTQYTSILKSKAVARASVGINRQLDLLDPTGKYSSTNSFCQDGMLYETLTTPTTTFTFIDTNDIATVINSKVQPIIKSRQMTHFYYSKFNRYSYTDVKWHQSTAIVNQTTGYFQNVDSLGVLPIGEQSSSNTKYADQSALLKFGAPTGFFFDANNRLVSGSPSKVNEKLYLWSTITELTLDGTNFGTGNLNDGTGPVTLNEFIPSEALLIKVIPKFILDLPSSLVQDIIDQISVYRNFGLGYNNSNHTWYIISTDNLDENAEYSSSHAQSTDGLGNDASWLIQFTTDGAIYTITYRSLNYYFASVLENRFIFDDSASVFDPKTGKTLSDSITVLKVNSKPDSTEALTNNISLDIVGQDVESDGFVDNFKVLVSFADKDKDGVADNPDIFLDIVDPTVNSTLKNVFFQKLLDFDNLERFVPLAANIINAQYATLNEIELIKTEYQTDQIFYAYDTNLFYKLTITDNTFVLTNTTEYQHSVGRQELYFQYKHNSPNTRRVDPATTNIVDLFLVTNTYYNNYINYIKDSTNKVSKPQQPTLEQLSLDYYELQDYKMATDCLILNSVTFKPLFGDKADVGLQGKIKVIKHLNVTVSNGEIKSKVVNALNKFFTIDKWDFGATFYFSELSAYLHSQLGDIISSVVIVPSDPNKVFGGLYEIRSAPNEIFVNAAGINDIDVVDALTASTLRQEIII